MGLDEHFRDNIYNFNSLDEKNVVRCKFFDKTPKDNEFDF